MLLFVLFWSSIYAQKVRLIDDTLLFLCKSDSLAFFFEKNILGNLEIDTLLNLDYYYDNGRTENEMQVFIWKQKGEVLIKAIGGCDEVSESNIGMLNGGDIFKQYFEENLFNWDHYLTSLTSHEYGYRFTLKQGGFKKEGYIRDSKRGIDHFEKQNRRARQARIRNAEKNPLVKWINQIDKMGRRVLKSK